MKTRFTKFGFVSLVNSFTHEPEYGKLDPTLTDKKTMTDVSTSALKLEPFVFNKPTYIIKAVDKNRLSPIARMPWPESGPVDDRDNFVPEMVCKGGLYGFTLDQVLDGTNYRGGYHDHFRVTSERKIFLILEVESSEIVRKHLDVKVPRCNVVGSFPSENWKGFLATWLDLMDRTESLAELETKFVSWMGFISLTDEIVKELRDWVTANGVLRVPGDGCQTQEHRDAYQFWMTCDFNNEPLSASKVSDLANFINTCGCPGARLNVWARLQKCSRWLFAVHPAIENIMIATVTSNSSNESLANDTYHISDYLSTWGGSSCCTEPRRSGRRHFRRTKLKYDFKDFVAEDRGTVTDILSGKA